MHILKLKKKHHFNHVETTLITIVKISSTITIIMLEAAEILFRNMEMLCHEEEADDKY